MAKQTSKISGQFPEFGAIFMSNGSTWEECLKRNLFGLPFSHAEFVKRVKVGMFLFLFEYEKRQLYGVFKAASDGEINIVSKAYDASGRLFPAQVRVTRILNCHPLSEHEFYNAIRRNYFAKNKFNFGLSKDQVYELLGLFELRVRHLVSRSCIRNEAGERSCMSSRKKAKVEKRGCHYTEKARKKLKMDVDAISESNLHPLAYSDRFFVADDSHCSAARNLIFPRKVSKNMCFQHARREACFQSSIAYVSSTSRHRLGHHFDTTRKRWVNSREKRKELDISSSSLDGDSGDFIPLSPLSDDHDTEDLIPLLSRRDLDPRESTSKARGKEYKEYNNKADESVLRVRSKKDFNTEADKSVKETMEELQPRHGNGDKKWRRARSFEKKNKHTAKDRTSVFLRLQGI